MPIFGAGVAGTPGGGPGEKVYKVKTGTDQTIGPASGEVAVSFGTGDTGDGFLFPSADGAKDYFVFYTLNCTKAAGSGTDTFFIRVGENGTVADTLAYTGGWFFQSGQSTTYTLLVRIDNPGASDLVTFSIDSTNANLTVHGSGTSATRYSNVLIWEDA